MVASRVESLVDSICMGESPDQGIRWADSLIRDSAVNSIEKNCAVIGDQRMVAAVESPTGDDLFEIRLSSGSRTLMTLDIERLSDRTILIRGWASE